MFGSSPVETTESVESTIEGISGLPINYSMFSIATPFPGTEFAERVKSGGWETPEVENLEENLSPTEKSLVSYPNLSKQALERAVKRANRRFYLNPKRLWHQIKKVNSLRALKDIVLTGWRVVK
jgi:hypothetical protein